MRIGLVLSETPWGKALLYLVITLVVARIVDALLARRDRAMAKVVPSDAPLAIRVEAWAIDPLKRRGLTSDVRAAVLRRLNDDGIYAAERHTDA